MSSESVRKPRKPRKRFHTVGPKELLKALRAEADALQKIHSNLRIAIQKLQSEEKTIEAMIRLELRCLRGQAMPASEVDPEDPRPVSPTQSEQVEDNELLDM